MSPTLAGGFFITSATWEAHDRVANRGLTTSNYSHSSVSLRIWPKLPIRCLKHGKHGTLSMLCFFLYIHSMIKFNL